MTNDQAPMTKEGRPGQSFDLAERTASFGESVIGLVRLVERDPVSSPLISQLVRSATSIGANYVEADEAGSKKEFRYRISVCRREARETQYWLRMLVSASPGIKDKARNQW
jgi:four helix bundle protein